MKEKSITPYWQTTRFRIDLATPRVMGIVNLTPDSFSDSGVYATPAAALAHAEQLLREGADILDVGGESTRPGAAPVAEDEEWRRLQPVLREMVHWQVPVSVDTRRSGIMRRVLDAGWADIINDVQALEDEGALAVVAASPDTGVCLMHMRGLPPTMQQQPEYGDVGAEVGAYLQARAEACVVAGMARTRLVLDPGFGFGKNLQHNTALMHDLATLTAHTGLPVLAGVSRKRMIGELSGEADAAKRVHGSVAGALAAVAQGAALVRVHDVKATTDALKVWRALAPTGFQAA